MPTTTALCPSSPTSAHHWKVEAPGGPLSQGVCKFCGTVRDFKNGYDYENRDKHHAIISAASAQRKARMVTRVEPPDRRP